MDNKTPISKSDRGKIVLKSTLQIGTKKAKHYAKRAFLTKENYQKEQEKIDNEIATILFKNISLLKGTAVKITQALVLHNILPKSIQKELAKSYNQIAPINKALVLKIVKDELGKDPSKLFKEFDLTPFASASLGQVHRAVTKDNQALAIKIQYPGIDKTIQNDIQLIKKFLGFKKNILRVIKEVEEKLNEEIDYSKELQNTLWAHRSFRSSDIIVPKVYKEYSTKHILTTSLIKGQDLYSWLQNNPSQKEKDKIANAIFSIFTDSIFKHNQIQADPNPANFIITNENKLTLIDFGCTKRFSKEFIKNYIEIFHIYKSTRREKILTLYHKMGFINNINDISDKIFQTKILPFNQWAIEPFLHDEYKFTKEYLNQGVQFANIFLTKPFLVVEDFIFLDRVSHGLFSLFEQMNATINMRKFRNYIGFI